MKRREFALALAASITGIASASIANQRQRTIEAVAIDGFALFSPKPAFDLARELFREQGASIANQWRAKIFEFTWLRASSEQYLDFEGCIRDALVTVLRSTKATVQPSDIDRLVEAYADLRVFPECQAALRQLKESGFPVVILANPTPRILERAVANAQLEGIFHDIISTDRAKTFKPSPRAYQLGIASLGLPAERIAFVASASWDASGASWFGYQSFWVNRMALPQEDLRASFVWTGPDLTSFAEFVSV